MSRMGNGKARESGGFENDNTAGEFSLSSGTLSGGISQQPSAVRFPGQVRDAANVDFSVVDGASKRAGSRWVRTISGLSNSVLWGLRTIKRDSDEAYTIVHGYDAGAYVVRVFEVDGPEATVTIDPVAQTYLNSGAPTSRLVRVRTTADATFFINTLAATGLVSSPSYTVTETWKDYDTMVSQTPAASTYHRATAASSPNPSGYYQYQSGDRFATWRCATLTGQKFTSPTGDWDETGNNPMGFRIGFRRVNLSNTGMTSAGAGTAWTLNKAGAFTSYTYVAGDMIRITGGTGNTAGWAVIVSRDSNDQITVSTDPASSSAVLAANTNTTFDSIGQEYRIEANFDKATRAAKADMFEVAAELQTSLRLAGCEDGLIAWIATGPSAGYFQITSPYKGSNTTVHDPTAPGSGFDLTASGRPFNATGSTATAGTGSSTSTRQSVTTRWTLVTAPAQPQAAPDPTTMPMLLTRTSFTGDGTTPATFTLAPATWSSRVSGDEDTNPAPPALVAGEPIKDIAYFQRRFAFTAGEYVFTTQTDDLFNFYIDDVANLVDSDPVKIPLGGNQIARGEYLLPFRKALLCFTEAGQVFEIGSEQAFTPSSATLTASINYQIINVEPVAAAGRVYFAGGRLENTDSRQTAQIREYVYDDLSASSVADDISAHVPTLIDASIVRIATVVSESVLVVLPADSNLFYVHRGYFTEKQRERVQSAWTKYIFEDDFKITDVATIENDLYMICTTAGSNEMVIEAVRLEPDTITTEF